MSNSRYLFRPVPLNPYLLVDDDDDDGRGAVAAPEDAGDDLESERVEMTTFAVRRSTPGAVERDSTALEATSAALAAVAIELESHAPSAPIAASAS